MTGKKPEKLFTIYKPFAGAKIVIKFVVYAKFE